MEIQGDPEYSPVERQEDRCWDHSWRLVCCKAVVAGAGPAQLLGAGERRYKSGTERLEAGPVEEGRGTAPGSWLGGRKWGQDGQSKPGSSANRPF